MASSQTASSAPLEKGDIKQNRDIAAFAYILIFAPILLITRRDSRFIQHHALQALYLGLFFVLFLLLPGRWSYLNIIVVAAALMGFLEAQAGNFYAMPVISDLIMRNITLRSVFGKGKEGLFYLGNILKRIFTEGPSFAVRGTVSAVQKARGIDALKVNQKVENLQKEVVEIKQSLQKLETKSNVAASTTTKSSS